MEKLKKWLNKTGSLAIIIFAFVFLVVSLCYKGFQYLSESTYAKESVIPAANGVKIKIVYPSKLKVATPEKTRQQISVEMTGYDPGVNIQVFVDFSGSEGLAFYDLEGNATSSLIVLDTTKAITGGGVFVSPEPLISSLDVVKLNVKVTVIDGATSYPTSEIHDNLIVSNIAWLDWLFAEGVAVSFVLALFGWVVDYRNKYKDEEKKDRLLMLQSLRESATTDPIEAMQRLHTYNGESWGEPFTSEFISLKNQFGLTKHLNEMFYLAGEALEQRDFVRGASVLAAIENYPPYKNKGMSDFVVDRLPDNKTKDLLETILFVWKKHDEYSRRVVVYIISRLYLNGQKALTEELIKAIPSPIMGQQKAEKLCE